MECSTKEEVLERVYQTKYIYIKHARDPNFKIKQDPLRVVAKVDIPKDTELFLDYRKEPLSDDYLRGHGKSYL